MIGTRRAGRQGDGDTSPDTAASAARRVDIVQARSDTMNAPSESPLAYTLVVSMQYVDSSEVRRVPKNCRSGFGLDVALVSQATGLPVPWGKAVTKRSLRPSWPNMEVMEWSLAPSPRPWMSRTRGTGTCLLPGGGVKRR